MEYAALLAVLITAAAASVQADTPDRWADAIAAFAQQDHAAPYPQGGVVFVGSSSIRLWDLEESFPKLDPPPLNRGFGGSEVSDSIRHAERLVLRHRPRLVVMYAGDNDIAAGKSPEQVHADFKAFAALVRAKLPAARLAYIAIKPSLKRWNLAPKMRKANDMIRQSCDDVDRLTFIDIWTPMLGDDGRPRRELFVEDGLHLSKEGYATWSKPLAPLLQD